MSTTSASLSSGFKVLGVHISFCLTYMITNDMLHFLCRLESFTMCSDTFMNFYCCIKKVFVQPAYKRGLVTRLKKIGKRLNSVVKQDFFQDYRQTAAVPGRQLHQSLEEESAWCTQGHNPTGSSLIHTFTNRAAKQALLNSGTGMSYRN